MEGFEYLHVAIVFLLILVTGFTKLWYNEPPLIQDLKPGAEGFVKFLKDFPYDVHEEDKVVIFTLQKTEFHIDDQGQTVEVPVLFHFPPFIHVFRFSAEDLSATGMNGLLKKMSVHYPAQRLMDQSQPEPDSRKAALRFLSQINKYLAEEGSPFRVFLLGNPVDTGIIFLRKADHRWLQLILKNRNIAPLEGKVWAKWNRLA